MHSLADLERIDKELSLLQQQVAHLHKRVDNLVALRVYIQHELEEKHEVSDDTS